MYVITLLQPMSSAAATNASATTDAKAPYLASLGERVRALRARRGLTRKALAGAADVSERHLANLESGTGNASILILLQVAQALQCPLAELVGDVTTSSAEWMLLRSLLEHQDDATIRRARLAVSDLLGARREGAAGKRSEKIALVGLRGAGKSTLGKRLADAWKCPFSELSREIERIAGCSVAEIQALYGVNAYRRYERRALEEVLASPGRVVIATPGGIVSDISTYNLVLAQCTTIWLQAAPEDHMARVAAQGDMRPMAASREAMEDLKGILAGRSPFYAKAEFSLNTSAQPLEETAVLLENLVKDAFA
jgi:XRE family transcriptional regulator, aerobic/anaerobic benzoate catabolism transcriptional regulator